MRRAVVWDRNAGRIHVFEFYTYAWCMAGPDCGKWYEGLHWAYMRTAEQKNRLHNGTIVIVDDPPALVPPKPELLEAFNKFNRVRKFKPCTPGS